MKHQPPRLAQRFFSWYCRNELQDSILGDLDERYFLDEQKHGTWKAKWLYWMGVIRFMNRFTLKKEQPSSNYFASGMLKNNLISSFRFFARNKGFAFINVFGLTLGFSSFLLILFFVNHEQSFDQFHANQEHVYRVNFGYQDNAGNVTKLVNSPPALAPGVSGSFPELLKISRLRYAANNLFVNGESRFYENLGYYADSLFLEILQFEFTSGNRGTALDEPNSIVITEELALKYFDDPNPLGSTLMFNGTTPLRITGVLKDLPSNSHLNFNFLISFSTYQIPEGYASDLTSWSWLGFLTYAELAPNTDPAQFEEKLVQHFKDLDPENPTPMIPEVQNLVDIYLGSAGMADDLASHIRSGSQFSVYALMLVAILILLIAGFNFSNLTSALSINRSKATGIRKVLGARRKSIMTQLFTESMVLTFLCLMISFGIVTVSHQSISQYMGWEFPIGWNEILEVSPVIFSVAILVSLISSFYPALTLARHDIIKSLKGALKIGSSRNPFQVKNVLVMIQFTISIGLICTTLIMTRQIDYLRNQDTGYNAESVVLVEMLPEDMGRYYEVFKDELVVEANVLSVSQSERVIGSSWPWSVLLPVRANPDESKRVFFNQVDYDYFESLNIDITAGRSFSQEYVNDPTKAIIINQEAADYLGLEDPVGKQVHFFELDGPRTIVGVSENFNYASLHQKIEPAVMILPFIDLEYMYVRFNQGDLQSQIETLESKWNKVSQGTPLAWRFLDDDLNQLYQSEEKLSSLIQVFTGLAIALACLGLYGLVTLMINNRIKEVGIRKVLGASIHSLYSLFAKKYVLQVTLAMLIILPLIQYLGNGWLEGFAYHIQISWLIYPMAALFLILMILITVTYQLLKATQVNPTNLLRDE